MHKVTPRRRKRLSAYQMFQLLPPDRRLLLQHRVCQHLQRLVHGLQHGLYGLHVTVAALLHCRQGLLCAL